jgi:hypothetical protein
MDDEITKEKIRRAQLAGPDSVAREAAVAEMDAQGEMTVIDVAPILRGLRSTAADTAAESSPASL